MARKNVVASHKMLDDADISTNQTSDVSNVTNLDRASISVAWSGTSPVGELFVEAKKQKATSQTADLDWKALDFGSSISITGNSGDHEIILNSLDFTHLRVRYASTSGTGTLTAVITSKQVGG